MKTNTLRLLVVSAAYFSLNPALATDLYDGTAAPASAAVPSDRIASRFESLAGSPANAASLVAGLRSGGEIRLRGGTSEHAISFTPATRPMGYGNISRSLALAQDYLSAQGITKPTPGQLEIALNGGTLTRTTGSGSTQTIDTPGILQLRSQGMGWGRIAHKLGVSPSNRPLLAMTGATGAPASAQAGIDLRGSTHGHGAVVTGDGSILHGRAPGYGGAGPGGTPSQTRGSPQASGGATSQPGRPAFAASGNTIGMGHYGKGPVQVRGNGHL